MKNKKYTLTLISITLFLSFLPFRTVLAMSIFDSMKVNLFSEMKGIVTLHGEPVAGALISRTAIPNNDREYTDSTITDSEGRFYFGPMEAHILLKLLPTQIVIDQKVVIEHQNKQHLAWKTSGVSGRDKGELNEIAIIGTNKEIDINLNCELTAKETDKAGAYVTVISGICNWNRQKILD